MPEGLLAGMFPAYTIANYSQLKQIKCSFETGRNAQPMVINHEAEPFAPYAVGDEDVVMSIPDYSHELLDVMKSKDDMWVDVYWKAVKNGYAELDCSRYDAKGMIVEAIRHEYWEVAVDMISYSSTTMHNATDRSGMNALCMASLVGAEEVVEHLLGFGRIDVDYEYQGQTAAALAHSVGNHDIATLIEDYHTTMMGRDDGEVAAAAA